VAACAVALLVAWVLARMPRAHGEHAAAPAHASVVPARSVTADTDDQPAHAPRLGERAASPAALQAAADVCGALARVQQPLELAGLVERMHGVLDSRGTIVWIYDEGADALRPGLSAGYASTTIGRMGTIPLSSDTPVATAFTRGEARSVRGSNDAPGALVVPIVTAGGVSGVVTIELPPGNDRQPATLALTRIFAAQLAGLLAVTPRPADVDGPEIVVAGSARAAAAAAVAAASDTRERAAGRFADLT
jgi:GAF domain-containing protein